MKAYQGDLSGGAPVCHQSIREGEHKKLGAFDPLQSFTLLGINIIPLISLLLQFLHFLVHMAIFLPQTSKYTGKKYVNIFSVAPGQIETNWGWGQTEWKDG